MLNILGTSNTSMPAVKHVLGDAVSVQAQASVGASTYHMDRQTHQLLIRTTICQSSGPRALITGFSVLKISSMRTS